MAQPILYPFDIHSLQQAHPILLNIVNVPELARVANAGAPLDPNAVGDAQFALAYLKRLHARGHAHVNQAAVEGAEDRLLALQTTHGTLHCGGGNLLVNLLVAMAQQHTDIAQLTLNVQAMHNDLQRVVAATDNIAKRSQNCYTSDTQGGTMTHMLSKTVIGSGHVLAATIAPNHINNINALVPAPAIGAVHLFNLSNIDSATHGDILHLVIFYNEGLNIVVGDTLPMRRGKLRDWLK